MCALQQVRRLFAGAQAKAAAASAEYAALPEVTVYPNAMKFMHWAMAGGIGGCVVTVQVGEPLETVLVPIRCVAALQKNFLIFLDAQFRTCERNIPSSDATIFTFPQRAPRSGSRIHRSAGFVLFAYFLGLFKKHSVHYVGAACLWRFGILIYRIIHEFKGVVCFPLNASWTPSLCRWPKQQRTCPPRSST